MKKPRVALIDYDMGNLRSVSRALEKVGCVVEWVVNPSRLKFADAMVLPGVGAFAVAVKNLKDRRLFDHIGSWIALEKPFLGICLGYQILFEESEENMDKGKNPRGIAVFEGKVKRLSGKKNLKIPHMGWNQVWQKPTPNAPWFKGIPDGTYFYFVHSYIPVPEDKNIICGTTDYGPEFASCISGKNLFASQFHPEKSSLVGIKLLDNFLKIVKRGEDDACYSRG